ncbi:DsbA family oxidoreductase [Sporosarcina sp. GW1-11]|uniref:DsbA family oxidoreductase n=1 Tax=Sporosarcina sp. GW1-11 TaxID=2899126 RepID=UPI00294F0D03|nr:DsbA family oxidoreductase [Sporosarcina sp. GW1-11]MDV6378475.1 DsbA family oxidoreductase [Sporosarcina sp. GW1-11]
MNIEIWSDYVCPFCYIGKRRLEEALTETGLTEKVEVQFKTYLLDPNTPVASGQSLIEGLAAKFSVSKVEAENMLKNIEEQAKTVGLHYQVNKMKTANTIDAHRLTKFASQHGKDLQVAERLMHGYFEEGEQIDIEEVLLAIAEEVGLDTEQAKAMLRSDDFTEEVQRDIEEAREIGIKGVPFFVFNSKYSVSGSQSREAFVEALEKVAQEEGVKPILQVLGTDSAGQCDDGSCDL